MRRGGNGLRGGLGLLFLGCTHGGECSFVIVTLALTIRGDSSCCILAVPCLRVCVGGIGGLLNGMLCRQARMSLAPLRFGLVHLPLTSALLEHSATAQYGLTAETVTHRFCATDEVWEIFCSQIDESTN